MTNYVTALTVFAKVEKGNGAFEYYRTRHDKKKLFHGWVRGHWKRMDTHTFIIMHDRTAMIHNTYVTVLTKEEEILKTVETSWFRKESGWRLVIGCCVFILVITINPEVAYFAHVYLAESRNWIWTLRYWRYGLTFLSCKCKTIASGVYAMQQFHVILRPDPYPYIHQTLFMVYYIFKQYRYKKGCILYGTDTK